MLLPEDIEYCRKLHQKHGKSYYFATRFFSEKIRNATFVLYAFFRIPDEIVDNPETTGDMKTAQIKLQGWMDEWKQAYEKRNSRHPALRATAEVFHTYQIPFEYSESFLNAMIQDVTVARYSNYESLQEYMYGSAAVVGLMMSYVIGFSTPKALPYATKLGYAMQLTNFLRDIDEDFVQRGRIYLPEEDMKRFGVTETQIKEKICDEKFVALMKFEIERARILYREAEMGIAMLHKDGRFAVRAASRLYGAILHKIEQKNYNIFSGRVRTSTTEKLWLVCKIPFTTL